MTERGIKLFRIGPLDALSSFIVDKPRIATYYKIGEKKELRYPMFYFGPRTNLDTIVGFVRDSRQDELAIAWIEAEGSRSLDRCMAVWSMTVPSLASFWDSIEANMEPEENTTWAMIGTRVAKTITVDQITFSGSISYNYDWIGVLSKMLQTLKKEAADA